MVTVAAQVQEAEAKNGSKEAGEEVKEKVAEKDVVNEDVAKKEDVVKKEDVEKEVKEDVKQVFEKKQEVD